jgi:hypothetical protein
MTGAGLGTETKPRNSDHDFAHTKFENLDYSHIAAKPSPEKRGVIGMWPKLCRTIAEIGSSQIRTHGTLIAI